MAPRAAGPAAAGDRSTQATLALSAALGLVAATVVVAHASGMGFTSELSTVVLLVPFGVVGFVVARHQPHNPIGWTFMAIVAGFAVLGLADAYEVLVYRQGHHWPLATLSLFVALAWAPVIVLLPLPVLLFPDGRLPSPRWRPVLWIYLAAGACWTSGYVAIVALAIHDANVHVTSGGDLTVVDKPTGSMAWFGSGQLAVLAVMLAGWLAFIGVQIRNWRAASGARRQQFNWLMCGAAACALSGAIVVIGSAVDPKPSGVAAVIANAAPLGLPALPVAIGVGILRYRLYEIDVIIRRTLVYASLVGLLAALYLGGIFLIDRALQAVTGQSSALAVTISTLAVAAAFQPLRTRIQRLVDRRFYRAKYDANRTLEAFSSRLRDQLDLDALHSEVLDVVRATVQPRTASLWLRPAESPSVHQPKEHR